MARLQAGDRAALEALYERFTPLMLGVAMRILRSRPDAEDVLQEAWVQAWNRRGSFDSGRGGVAAWLVTIARSRAVDRRRWNAARGRTVPAAAAEPQDPAEGPEEAAGRGRTRERLARALDQLDPKHRQVLEIAYWEGLPQSAIAERLGVPLGTVKYWTRQGLIRLRELAGGMIEDD